MIVLHPGFAKTATKTLQNGVFFSHDQVHYLGLPAAYPAVAAAINDLANCDSTKFDIDQTKSLFKSMLSCASPEKTVVLSHENFSLYESTDKGVIANRLYNIFGPCKILFTIRRQEEVLVSWYMQKISKYIGGHNFISFDNWFRIKTKEPHRSIFDDLDYENVVSTYETIFGRENVNVLLFEQLRDNPQAYARELANILNIDAHQVYEKLSTAHYNRTIAQREIDFGRITTRYVPRVAISQGRRLIPERLRHRFDCFLRSGPAARVKIRAAAHDWVRSNCVVGNRALNVRYGNRLAKYGYAL